MKRWWVYILKYLVARFFFLYTDKIGYILTVNILSYWHNYSEGEITVVSVTDLSMPFHIYYLKLSFAIK